MWRNHDVRGPDLGMVIYNPATPADADRIRSLLKPGTRGQQRPGFTGPSGSYSRTGRVLNPLTIV